MTRYEKLSDIELDNMLSLAFSLICKGRVLDTDYFCLSVYKKIENNKLEFEFGVIYFSRYNQKNKIEVLIFNIVNTPMRIFKMAALKTYDENREYFK